MVTPGRSGSALILLFGLINVCLLSGQEYGDGTPADKSVIITGVGDIMPGTSFPSDIYLPPGNDPAPLLASVIDFLDNSDILFANLEGPFINEGEPAKKCRDTSTCYAFRIPEHYAAVLGSAGFNLLSLANNHIGDFGIEGRNRTIELLDSLGIEYAGPEDYPYSIFVEDSIVYGFCAFSPNKGMSNITDIDKAGRLVSMLNDSCDIVIVSMHGGAEGADYQHVTREIEEFYGENRGNVYEFAHRMIDHGADIIFGHGPHVTRALEIYRERFIAYSLGNFCTYRRFNINGPNGYAPIVRVRTDRSGKFIDGTVVPIYQDNNGHVKYDSRKRVIFRLREMMAEDFPGMPVSISDDGMITYD